jgi:hypothetical protein
MTEVVIEEFESGKTWCLRGSDGVTLCWSNDVPRRTALFPSSQVAKDYARANGMAVVCTHSVIHADLAEDGTCSFTLKGHQLCSLAELIGARVEFTEKSDA